jgi:Haem-NO-binding
MYGMIHRAARELALQTLTPDEWEALLVQRGLREDHFISANPYDDAVTARLLEAIGGRLAVSQDALLEALGRHWIRHAAASPFGTVLTMAGDDLETFLENLDRMHASVTSSMPAASMPSFELLRCEPQAISLLYQSERAGLGMFVRGILCALLERFGETGRVDMEQTPSGVLFRISERRSSAETCAA